MAAAKWADYCITRVRYNSQRTHIVKVEVLQDLGDSFGPATEQTRDAVVTAIQRGTSYVTVLRGSDNKLYKGQEVGLVKVNGVNYIRTDKNARAADNLENLPEF